MTSAIYLAIGCGIWLLLMLVMIFEPIPDGHEEDDGFYYGDWPHLPDGIGNVSYLHGRMGTPSREGM